MNLETIEKLIKFMESHDLTELQVREGDLEFKARRGERREMPFAFQPVHGIVHGAEAAPAPQHAKTERGPVEQASKPAAVETGGAKKNQKEICSPIVGTFYRRPNPKSPPYKEVGDRVEKDDVVCIVEAMKVMNEIRAEVSGTIVKILVDDATPVEFGQALFLVEPS
ncbi:MAG: acetyl-CoA carboxylase biotin carboxyl carrier protein [Planctomycetota bacterium]|nr:acetyl-CoA carboxylase biotin carboxyl carrier protein [Planctomycetota bacterium]